MGRFGLIFACLLLGPSTAPSSAQRYQTQVITETEGLPSSRILDVEQDNRGRLWILSRAGLTIYDGEGFAPARILDRAPSGPFAAIARNARGEMVLVGSGDRPEVARRALGGQWTLLAPPTIGPATRRLLAAGPSAVEIVIAPTEAGGVAWDGDTWRDVVVSEGARITALLARDDGILVGTNRGLYRLDGAFTLAPHPAEAPVEGEILAMTPAESGGVWLLSNDWIGRLDGETSRRIVDASIPTIYEPTTAAILDDGSGGVFFGSQRAMFKLDLSSRRWHAVGVAEGLASKGAVDLLRDREGGIWFASARGLTRMAGQRFLSYGPAQGLLQAEVSAAAMLPDANGERWVLGHNRGFTLLEPGGARTAILPERRPTDRGVTRVLDIAIGDDGRIYAATSASGLIVFRPEPGDEIVTRRMGVEAGIDFAQSVDFDPEGTLWVVEMRGLYRRQGGDFVREALPISPDAWLRWLRFEGEEAFLSTDRGLVWRRHGEPWRVATSDEPGANQVYRALRDRSGRLLVGTSVGLFEVQDDALVRVRDATLRTARPVYLVLQDAVDRIWLGTDNGALVSNGVQRRRLGVRHGLAGREINRGAGIADARGQIWLGTEGGFSVYQPRYDANLPPRPVVELRHVDTPTDRFALDRPLALEPEDRNLTFVFHAVTLAPELGLRMRCRLHGFEAAWLEPCPNPSGMRYTNLPPGSFRIEAQAKHADGPWGMISTSAPIRLPPPFWRSPGFAVLLALLGLLVGWLLWRAFDRKRHAADHDPLTGLPNRTWFFRRLARAIGRGGRAMPKRTGRPRFVVLFLDLDGFKHINDSLGHLVGDRFLIAIAERLREAIDPFGAAARIGGDEFALLVELDRHTIAIDTIIDTVRGTLSPPFAVAGRELYTDVSIGVVWSDDEYARPDQVLRDADTAMYRAKAKGRGRTEVFDRSMRSHAADRLDLETDLRRALDLDQLRLDYQPIVSPDGTAVIAVEALLRWEHPERGRLSPDRFIELAEEIGAIVPIGSWVIDESFRQIAAWRRLDPGLPACRIHVNVSAAQLYRADVVDRVNESAMRHGVEPCAIALELTERVLVRELDHAAEVLDRLRDLGVATFLDDFGRGQTSLRYLRRLPLDGLKLDRAFVAELDANTKDLEIARMVILLGRRLGLDVVAEGVETEAQLRLLDGLQCQALQGFLFHRPMAPDRLLALLQSPSTRVAGA